MKRLKNPLLGILIVMGLGLVLAQSFGFIDATKYLKPDTVTPVLLKANATTPDNTKFYRGDGRWEAPTGTVSSVGATAPAAGFSIAGSPITTSGTLTFTLANDLAAVEGLTGTGWAKRTGVDTWSIASAIAISDVTSLQTSLDNKLDDSQATAFGLSLLDDADATAGRTTLGLGSLATLSAVGSTEITDGTVAEADLNISNTASRDQFLQWNGTALEWHRPFEIINLLEYDTGAGTNTMFADAFTAAAGKALYIPEGTYTITAKLEPPADTFIYGPPTAVITATTGTFSLIEVILKNNVWISGITLDAGSREGANETVLVSGAIPFRMHNVTIKNSRNYGAWFYNSDVEVKLSRFQQNKHSVFFDGNSRARTLDFVDNTIENTDAITSQWGVLAYGAKAARLNNNRVVGIGHGAVPGVNYTLGNQGGTAFFLYNNANLTLAGNITSFCRWAGLVLGATTQGAAVTGNSFRAGSEDMTGSGDTLPGDNAVWVEQAATEQITLAGNTLYGGTLVGDGGGIRTVFVGNTIYTKVQGIDVSTDSKTVIVSSNVIRCTDGSCNRGIYLFQKTDSTKGHVVSSNAIEGFDIGIEINNSGGTGTAYALAIVGNDLVSNTTPLQVSGTVALDASVKIRGNIGYADNIATADIANNAITNAKFRQSTALTVVGRSANSTGDVADIAAGADGDVLRRSGTTLGFGSIPQASVTSLVSDLALKSPLASPTFTGTPAAPTAAVDTNTTQLATTAFVLAQAAGTAPSNDAATAAQGSSTRYARQDHQHQYPLESFQLAASDLATDLTTGTGKAYFRMPYAFTVTAIRCSLNVAQSAGSALTVDINEAGTTIMATNKCVFDNTEETTVTAATAPVASDTSLADDAKITVDIDTVGTAGARGLIVTIIGRKQ